MYDVDSWHCTRMGVLKFELGMDVRLEVYHHFILKPEKMQICNPCKNNLFLEGPFLGPLNSDYAWCRVISGIFTLSGSSPQLNFHIFST